jgi:hypothetical protein
MRPPEWVEPFCEIVAAARPQIDSASTDGLTSDLVLGHIAPGLISLGFELETGKSKSQKLTRPVLFGASGSVRVPYEVDGVHDELGIVLEVEAGRGARGNAVYRDLIRTSLIVDVRFLVLGVMRNYRHRSATSKSGVVSVRSYEDARNLLDAIYASGRLQLPFEGVLLFGY